MLGLRLILLKQHLPKEWEAAGESQLTTLTSESGYHKKQGRRCLYPTAFPMSTEQFSFFPLFASILFFLPAARPQCHLPCQRGLCHQGARTPECQERQQEALNQGHSSTGTKTVRSPDAWTEQISSVFEHSECNPSPRVPTEGIGRRKTHDMLCWADRWKGFICSRTRTFTPTQTMWRHKAQCLSTLFPVCKQIHNHDNTGLRVTMN